jgi:hypothetical protein
VGLSFLRTSWIVLALLGISVAEPAPSAYRIYINGFGNGSDASELRKDLMKELSKTDEFEIVSSPAKADGVLGGDAELYVRSYVSLYARAGTSLQHGQPVYGGYVSVEVKDPSGQTVWSYLSTLHSGSRNASRELCRDIAKHLEAAFPFSTEKK